MATARFADLDVEWSYTELAWSGSSHRFTLFQQFNGTKWSFIPKNHQPILMNQQPIKPTIAAMASVGRVSPDYLVFALLSVQE